MRAEPGRSFWEDAARRYDRSMWLLGGPMPEVCARVAEVLRGAERVLELASGTGLVTEAIAPVVGELLATDYADEMVARTRARVGAASGVRCERRDLYALGEPPASFDAVVAANVLHLLPELEAGLAAAREVLRPEGLLVVPTYLHDQGAWARATSWGLGMVGFPGQRRFDLDGLVAAVDAAGFEVVCAEVIPGLLPVGFVAARRSSGPSEAACRASTQSSGAPAFFFVFGLNGEVGGPMKQVGSGDDRCASTTRLFARWRPASRRGLPTHGALVAGTELLGPVWSRSCRRRRFGRRPSPPPSSRGPSLLPSPLPWSGSRRPSRPSWTTCSGPASPTSCSLPSARTR